MKVKNKSEVPQSCPTLSDPMDSSPPGFSVHGISQARVLEWGLLPSPEKGSNRYQIKAYFKVRILLSFILIIWLCIMFELKSIDVGNILNDMFRYSFVMKTHNLPMPDFKAFSKKNSCSGKNLKLMKAI